MEIIVVPVAHISRASIRRVHKTVKDEKPDVVAVELDAARFHAMAQGKKPSLRDILSRPLLALLYFVQQALGEWIGVMPGSEMMAAVEAAKKSGARVAFVDRPMNETVARLATIPLQEKLSIAFQLLLSVFVFIPIPFRKQAPMLPEDFIKNGVPEEFLKIFKSKLPNTFRVLVEERDEYMFEQLKRIDAERIVLVIGAGHIAGIARMANADQERPPKGVAA